MKELLKLFFRAQTILGLIPFVVLVISDCVMIGVRQSTYDIEAFSCFPTLNASTKQRCYDQYSSKSFLQFCLVLVFDGMICLAWIISMVKTTLVLRQIKRCRQIENNESEQTINPRLNWSPAEFAEKSCCSLCVVLTSTTIVIILLTFLHVSDSGFIASSMYKCSLHATDTTDTTSIPTNQTKTDFYCDDQKFKEKINLSIATAVIKLFIWILCMISFIYVLKTPEDQLMNALLGDVVEEREINLQGKLTISISHALNSH